MRWSDAQLVAVVVMSLSAAACGEKGTPDSEVYTLYAGAGSDKFNRGHEATFDSHYGEAINAYSCERAQRLLQAEFQRSIGLEEVKVWCEKGRYKK